jgi:glycosyltransferase involved in cell wall biosynthesis
VTRLAVLTSHPIQYYAPLFRALARAVDLRVLFAHHASPAEQAKAGFGTPFAWDVDLTSGYAHSFLKNVARRPGTDHFLGCDTPGIGERLRAGCFHALLVLGWHLKTYVQGGLAARRLGIPVMVRGDSQLETPRSPLKTALKSLTYPRLLRLFDAALYVGQRSHDYYVHYGYPTGRLFFSPHCVDTEWFGAGASAEARVQLRQQRAIAPETFLVLFAGRLLPFKRPADVVAAAAQCRAQGLSVEMMVAGSGELEPQLKAAATAARVPLHLLGFRNQTEMPAAYAAADCLVLPSDGRETWGLVANEALACRRPIIVSHACGCAPDLGCDGRAGRTFPMGDTGALARAIVELAAAPPPSSDIAALSRTYSIESAVDGILCAAHRLGAPS